MNCPNCEAEIKEEATECPECGEPVKVRVEPEKETPVLTGGDEGKKRQKDNLSRDDLIAGLRAAADGTPMDDFLPSEHWEDYTASLLEVLFDKHLVFPAEIDRELKNDKENE